jgi:hypothetical protein
MTPKAILEHLDQAARDIAFPMLDNGYVYPADVRLSIYRDSVEWLMIMEQLGVFVSKVTGCEAFQNCLYLFGSPVVLEPALANMDILYPIESLPDDQLFEDDEYWEDQYEWNIRPEARALCVRGQRIAFDTSAEALAQRGLELVYPPNIDPVVVLRSLLPEHRELLLATEEELDARNPTNLPLFMRLDQWFHPDLAAGDLPSDCETFQLLAKAIASGDSAVYRPTCASNTHWRNWPEGGTL